MVSKGFNFLNDYPNPKLHCQCGGTGYIGSNECDKNLYCHLRTNDYSQCSGNETCPAELGWKCESN